MIALTRLGKVIALGLIALLLGIVFSEFVTSPRFGHRIDFEKLPAEAQSILKERPGLPISPEQWKRLDQVMARSEGWVNAAAVFWASMRHSWYWFLTLPLLSLGALYLRWKSITPIHAGVILLPSVGFLLIAFLK